MRVVVRILPCGACYESIAHALARTQKQTCKLTHTHEKNRGEHASPYGIEVSNSPAPVQQAPATVAAATVDATALPPTIVATARDPSPAYLAMVPVVPSSINSEVQPDCLHTFCMYGVCELRRLRPKLGGENCSRRAQTWLVLLHLKAKCTIPDDME
jgi:hypothetical protein